MTTRECYLWLHKKRERLGTVDRPSISCQSLFAEEKRRRQSIGMRLFHDLGSIGGAAVESGEPDRVEEYLTLCRLAFSERQALALTLPYSPCRVRDWCRERHLHWLLIVSWNLVGVKEWQEIEILREAQNGDHFAT